MKVARIAKDVVLPQDADIADSVVIERGVLLSERLVIENDVHVGPGVVFAEGGSTGTIIRARVRIAAGAVIGAGTEIGWGAQVLPGSVVLAKVPANAIVGGNPARITGYTHGIAPERSGGEGVVAAGLGSEDRHGMSRLPLGVGEAALFHMTRVSDLRGSLTVGEFRGQFPFDPARYFIVFDVPSEELRGEHAHRLCHQFLICVQGSCRALLDDGRNRREVVLDRPDLGLHMPPMIWGTQYRYTRDAVLLVLASHPYDAADYIRTYDDFLAAISGRRS